LWGTIQDVEHTADIREFFARVPFKEVIPTADSLEEAIATAEAILGLDPSQPKPVLGFKVALEE
jgi:hypothetical protein